MYAIAKESTRTMFPFSTGTVDEKMDSTFNMDVDHDEQARIEQAVLRGSHAAGNDGDIESPSSVVKDDNKHQNNDNGKKKKNNDEQGGDFVKLPPHQNHPHPMLEFPILFHCLRSCCSCLLGPVLWLYNLRWSASYPLQRRLPFTRTLRKIKVIYTWTELLLILPFFACMVAGALYSFVYPSVSISGHACRTPLIFAFCTAMHNSFLTLLFGLPFERALRYHKLSARLAYFNSLLHTYVAFRFPMNEASPKNFFSFLFFDQINTGGTMLVFFMTGIVLTALPFVRRRCFEVFYYLHVFFCLSMTASAFFHTGFMVPMLVGICWGGDLFFRKVIMAWFWYPQTARIRTISNSVVEVSFQKTKRFAFNPGQYISICIPELSLWQWHPFSLSSSPEQDRVTLHIRKAGWFTTELYKLAENKDFIEICLEGPYGSVGVDLMSNKYSSVLLFSGGIGVTPMQSICNQLMYEHNTKKRQLKKVSFVWIERDPQVFEEVDVVRYSSSRHLNAQSAAFEKSRSQFMFNDDDSASIVSAVSSMAYTGDIATTLLANVPVNRTTDAQLEELYPTAEFQDLDILEEEDEDEIIDIDQEQGRRPNSTRKNSKRSNSTNNTGRSSNSTNDAPAAAENGGDAEFSEISLHEGRVEVDATYHGDYDHQNDPLGDITEQSADLPHQPSDVEAPDCRVLSNAYPQDPEKEAGPLDLQVYLTGKGSPPPNMPPFIHFGRPDVKGIFQKLRDDALLSGERRIAVCVCAPMRLVNICRRACAKYSDRRVAFDFHYEVFD